MFIILNAIFEKLISIFKGNRRTKLRINRSSRTKNRHMAKIYKYDKTSFNLRDILLSTSPPPFISSIVPIQLTTTIVEQLNN